MSDTRDRRGPRLRRILAHKSLTRLLLVPPFGKRKGSVPRLLAGREAVSARSHLGSRREVLELVFSQSESGKTQLRHLLNPGWVELAGVLNLVCR